VAAGSTTMARKRNPLEARPRYHCAVFGKPISFQPKGKTEKSSKYPKWREEVAKQVAQVIRELSGDRGFEMILDPVCVHLIWYSPNIDDSADPDLDNIAKPYLDAIKGLVIPDDRNVRLLRTIKVDINSELPNIPEVVAAKNSPYLEVTQEFVMIVVEPFDDEHLRAFAQDMADE
jgi:Holliday junction resolvase RusA-like endonuclease